MPKQTLRRYIPTPMRLRQIKSLGILGEWIYEPNLWHINRYATATAFFVGIFMAFMPIPGQMIAAAMAAIWLRCNLPLSVALCWISNPLTMPPIFYFAYKVGERVLSLPPRTPHFELSWHWLTNGLALIWQPFLLGCLLCGLLFASLGYLTIRLLWRWQAVQRWEARRVKRRLALEKASRDVALRQAELEQLAGRDKEPPENTTAQPPH